MASVKFCPSCGSPNIEQIDEDLYQCPYCGKTIGAGLSHTVEAPMQEISVETTDEEEYEEVAEVEEETPINIFSIIGGIFYLVGIADFCGMFFGYDFTGIRKSPIYFAAIGSLFMWLARKI